VVRQITPPAASRPLLHLFDGALADFLSAFHRNTKCGSNRFKGLLLQVVHLYNRPLQRAQLPQRLLQKHPIFCLLKAHLDNGNATAGVQRLAVRLAGALAQMVIQHALTDAVQIGAREGLPPLLTSQ
jgi:hypothetical protein